LREKHQVFVSAVIVTFEPNLAALKVNLAAIQSQVTSVVVFDNSEQGEARVGVARLVFQMGAQVLGGTGNLGLAVAYNQALSACFAKGASHVLLLDQDSCAQPGCVDALLAATNTIGHGEAVCGPALVDPRTSRSLPFVSFGTLGLRRTATHPGDAPVPCDFLISSGSLISRAAFERVGPFPEHYFIDHVDTYWCIKARALGVRILGVPGAQMQHEIGDAFGPRLPGLDRQVFSHSPLRLYYQIRNCLDLVRNLPEAPLRWRLILLSRALSQALVNIAFIAPRWGRLKSVCCALFGRPFRP
jgi:rhamnosyltransferase